MKLKRFLKLFSFTAFLALVCCFSAFAVRETGTYGYDDFHSRPDTVEYEVIDSQIQGERVKKLVVYNYTTEYKLSEFFIEKFKRSGINLRSIVYKNLEYNLIKSQEKFGLSLSIRLLDPESKYKNINYSALEILFRHSFGRGQPCIDEVIIEDEKIEVSYCRICAEGVIDVDNWNGFWKCRIKSSFLGLKKETLWPCCCDGVIRFYGLAAPVGKFREVFEPLVQRQRDAFRQEQLRIKKLNEEAKQQKEREWQEEQARQESAKKERRQQEVARIAKLPKSEQLKIEKAKLQQELLKVKRRLIAREEELEKCEHRERVTGKRCEDTEDTRGYVRKNRQQIVTLESEIEEISEQLAGLKVK